ncbi:MAG: nuclear transport factor 2 family protein [Actinomycetota bacterium]|nr:nuclear transport factor 2 family protein [Actinomycetota bacterium]
MAVDEREVEAAFRQHWTVGSLEERWAEWPDRLTADVRYIEHVFGEMDGREAVRTWITGLMAARADVHAVLDWYMIKGSRVVLNMRNRYYHPDPAGTHMDFPGLTVLEYAGDGLFGYQEDYWCVRTSKTAYAQFSDAVAACGGRGLGDGRFQLLEAERRAQTEAVFARGG